MIFIVIGPDDEAYGPFISYNEAYDWAESKWSEFSIYEVKETK